MSTKPALKAAKSAIDSKKWDEAIAHAETVLHKDPQNYFAKLFLGRANDGLGKLDDAAAAYTDATRFKPDDPQAWLGLRGLYEKQKGAKVDENTDVGLKLAELYADLDDTSKSQTAIDKLISHAHTHGTTLQYAHALTTQLPSSPIYPSLSSTLPAPATTYTLLATLHETHETSLIPRLIAERKTRIGATLHSTTLSVKHEVYSASPLEGVYRGIIDWTRDDKLRRVYEERLLERVWEGVLAAPAGEKEGKRRVVMELARGMVVIGHPFLLAWEIELEWGSGQEVEVN